jgi:hypothetical protein
VPSSIAPPIEDGRHSVPATQGCSVSDVMTSLRAGVPISLLLDLAAVDGPDSACILATEAPDDEMDWIAFLAP